jgi:transposase
MDSHIHSSVSRLDVVETGRRRRWSETEKERIALESMAGPRRISATARRYGISRSQLLAWRRALIVEATVSPAGFLPVVAAFGAPVGQREAGVQSAAEGASSQSRAAQGAAAARDAVSGTASGRIEIVLRCGRRMIVDALVDADAVARLARGLEALA